MASFIAHHGTSLDAAISITTSKRFILVESDEKYLGNGAYFFKAGIGNSIVDAKNFAIRNAFDKGKRAFKYDKYGVVEADISVQDDKILDLNSEEGIKIFDLVRKEVFKKKKLAHEKMTKIDDGFMVNLLEKKGIIPMDVVLQQKSICLDPQEIELKLRSYVPNCIICCVKNHSCIVPGEIVDKGDVA